MREDNTGEVEKLDLWRETLGKFVLQCSELHHYKYEGQGGRDAIDFMSSIRTTQDRTGVIPRK